MHADDAHTYKHIKSFSVNIESTDGPVKPFVLLISLIIFVYIDEKLIGLFCRKLRLKKIISH